jgi:hypothetical protein
MDDSVVELLVSNELAHPFFFSQKKVLAKKPAISFSLSENFIYEIFYYNKIETFKPWSNAEEIIPVLLNEWQTVKDELNALHHERQSNKIVQSMKKGIGLFIQLLFWSNGKPVQLNEPFSFSELDYKPVNIHERLEFIISRPKLFHSFIQLSELMIEQEKHYVKKNILKKASRPKV